MSNELNLDELDLDGLLDIDLEGGEEGGEVLDLDLEEVDEEEEKEVTPEAVKAEKELKKEEPTPKATRRKRQTPSAPKKETPVPAPVATSEANDMYATVLQHRIAQIESEALKVPGGQYGREAAVSQLRWALDLRALLERE